MRLYFVFFCYLWVVTGQQTPPPGQAIPPGLTLAPTTVPPPVTSTPTVPLFTIPNPTAQPTSSSSNITDDPIIVFGDTYADFEIRPFCIPQHDVFLFSNR